MKATFIQSTGLSDVITSFSFRPERAFTYTAGQFIDLALNGHQESGQPARRWFTLSSSPHEELLTITTRVGAAAHSDFKRALNNLAPGATVTISEPLGDFVLPKLRQTPLIFVAGGIGITPFNSMLGWLTHSGEERPINLLYSVKNEADIIFQDTFDAAKQHATIVVEQPSAAWGGERGTLTGEMITGLDTITADALIYISGPEPFVQRLQRELRQQGVAHHQLVLDEFQGYEEV
jgi:ferredoxin-NADP reductase